MSWQQSIPNFKLYFVDTLGNEWAQSPISKEDVLQKAAAHVPAGGGLGFVIASPTVVKVYRFGHQEQETALRCQSHIPSTWEVRGPQPLSEAGTAAAAGGGGAQGERVGDDPMEMLIVADELRFWLAAGSVAEYLRNFSKVRASHC